MSESRIICYKTPTQYAYRSIVVEEGHESVGKPRYFRSRSRRDLVADNLAQETGWRLLNA